MNDPLTLLGTEQHDSLASGSEDAHVVGLAGDDVITTHAGNDLIYGDYIARNLLEGSDAAVSFAQFGATGAWEVVTEPSGHTRMSQTVETQAGTSYEIAFELAANYGAGTLSGAIEVLWNGVVVDSFDTNSAVFDSHSITLAGTGGPGELTFRAIESAPAEGPQIHTDAPVFYYEKTVDIAGADVSVKAIAPGQAHIYQVMNGTLHVFDPQSETYTKAGHSATVVSNAIGFNQEDDLIYGIAVRDGVDSRGVPIAKADLVMLDASGASFRVGATPYRSWTADFDDAGNLWAFEADMDRVTMIDVDQVDANGDPVSVTFKFPTGLVTDKVWDLAYDAASQTFFGLVKPAYEGGVAKLMTVDISAVADGGAPVFATTPVTATLIDGVRHHGVPNITFGAFVIDGDGNLYAGGNGGDHDMNNATGSSGGIYRVETEADGSTILVLVADAPKAYSNDGAVDPRAMDPFTQPDRAAQVLIRKPSFVETPEAATSYDDTVDAGAGGDAVYGGFGADLLAGASGGDTLSGGVGDDTVYGGAAEAKTWIVSHYDEEGARFDQNGTLLGPDDDVLYGGTGADMLSGSAGHDLLYGDTDADSLFGGSGADILYGGLDDDHLSGGSEDDALYGDAGADMLEGGSGDDQLSGGADADTLMGGSGDDGLSGGSGADLLEGGSGADDLSGGLHDDRLYGGSDADLLAGDGGTDRLSGGSGADDLFGGDARDYVDGGSGDDTLFGGDGNDHLTGGSGADVLAGDQGSDYLSGHTGDDVLNGGAGVDRLYLGAGNDIATGGAQADRFVFRSDDLDGGQDVITDFRAGEGDTLDLRALSLLSEMTEAQWTAAHLSWAGDAVEVSLGSSTLRVLDHDDLGAALLDQLADALIF
ncbi:MAG: calcium-binding protein [Pseudomonadota bacterium]